MTLIILLLAILAFLWYYKSYMMPTRDDRYGLGSNLFGDKERRTKGKKGSFNELFTKINKGARGFGRGFVQGAMEERLDEYKRRMNYYVVALLAKIAKSDGRVSQKEAEFISDLLNANASSQKERDFLKASFNEHKKETYNASYVALEFMREVPLPHNERLNIFRMFIFVAGVDGELTQSKINVLGEIATAFRLKQEEFSAFIESILNQTKTAKSSLSLDEAYKILGLDKNTNASELKKRYRELAKKYHPDVLNANNVSEAELQKGVENFHKINEAYEILKKHLEK